MDISALKKQRGTCKQKLTNFKKFLDPLDECKSLSRLQASELSVRLSRFEELYTEFDNIQTNIEQLCDSSDDEREEFESKYFSTFAVAKEALARSGDSAPRDVDLSVSGSSSVHGGQGNYCCAHSFPIYENTATENPFLE
ncbi:uncharacterized protein LOC123694222 [Colias croceus]|uniref:uncharacterized protein LOC123694222 n=1 Tax=Colias crocea TaxID=72248 RepID=UPI001E27FC9E|nr:uncharacterized protein LOC123694222 [Colias croceus]